VTMMTLAFLWDNGILDGVLSVFDRAVASWPQIFFPLALRLFLGLAAIEMTWTAIRSVLAAEGSLERFFELILRKALYLGFVYFLVSQASSLFPRIIQGFQTVGQLAAGPVVGGNGGPLQPSAFLSVGVDTAILIWTKASVWGLLTHGFTTELMVIATAIILFSFALMSAALVMVLIESRIVLGAAFFLIAFAGSRWTYSLAEGVLAHVFRVAIRLMLLTLVSSIFVNMAVEWRTKMLGAPWFGPQSLLAYLGALIVLPLVVFSVSRMAGQIVPRHFDFGLNPKVMDN